MMPADAERKEMAAEVVQLGQALFEAVVEDARLRPGPPTRPDEPFPAEQVTEAGDRFFRTLRRLLDLEMFEEED
jgi:hypothetical protein